MGKIVSDLNDYVLLVDKYFSKEKIDESTGSDPQDFRYLFSTELQNTWERKKTETNRWDQLIQLLGKFEWIVRPKDMSFDVNHGFKVVLNLEQPDIPTRYVGVICHLSLIGDIIGFYYSDTDTTRNTKPIGYPVRSSSSISMEQYEAVASYFPFNDLHTKYRAIIIQTIQEVFPEFIEFDNRFADHKITSIQFDDDFYASIDLFQVFFGNNINGVV